MQWRRGNRLAAGGTGAFWLDPDGARTVIFAFEAYARLQQHNRTDTVVDGVVSEVGVYGCFVERSDGQCTVFSVLVDGFVYSVLRGQYSGMLPGMSVGGGDRLGLWNGFGVRSRLVA